METAQSTAAAQAILERNRQSARHSTGPITPQGKAICSQNSFKHGLASYLLVTNDEKKEDFDELEETLVSEHRPANEQEALYVHHLARHEWLAQRAIRLQGRLLTINELDLSRCAKELSVLLRYQTANERAFHKALDQLRKLQKERLQAESTVAEDQTGSVSQDDETGFAPQDDPAGSVSQNAPSGSVSQNEVDEIAFQYLRDRYGDDHLLKVLYTDLLKRQVDAIPDSECPEDEEDGRD